MINLDIFIATFIFIYLFIFGCAVSSVRARAFSSCGKWGPLFIAVRGPLFIASGALILMSESVEVNTGPLKTGSLK